MWKRAAGFTLVDLVVIVVILGVLVAIAVPKFINADRDARAAAMKSVDGMMRSVNGIVHAKAAGAGNDAAAPGSVTVDGVAVATKFGYARDATNLALVMDLDSKIVPGTCGRAPGTPCLYHSGAANGTTGCFVSYAAPAAPGDIPAYTMNVTACD